MSTRISENQSVNNIITQVRKTRADIDRIGNDISSGVRVRLPGDSESIGSVIQFQSTIDRIAGYKNRVTSVESLLNFSDNGLQDVSQLLQRGLEIATQGANETNSPTIRSQMSEEVWQIRDHLVSLANQTYQGKYIYHGALDTQPPYSAATYTSPATGSASQRYVFDVSGNPGATQSRTVQLSDDVSIVVNTPGNQIFDGAIQAMERLGRALAGYTTTPASGAPSGGGVPYSFPAEFSQQSRDIASTVDLLKAAQQTTQVERTALGGKLERLKTASSLLDLNKGAAQDALGKLQDTDTAESATELTQAQTALQASLQVTARLTKLSILDFI